MAIGIRGMRIGSQDRPAAEAFLNTVPNAAEILKFLLAAAPGAGSTHQRFYDPRTRTASYVTTWRGRVVCLMALEVTDEQSISIEAYMAQRSVIAWTSLSAFQDSVEAALGTSVNLGQPKGEHLAKWWEPAQL